MYESLILVDPDARLDAEALASQLVRFYTGKSDRPDVVLSGETIKLIWPTYHFIIHYSCAPHVVIESREIAARFGMTHAAKDRIAHAQARFETSAPDDPEMAYFNDYLYIGEAAERKGPVFRFDQSSATFLE